MFSSPYGSFYSTRPATYYDPYSQYYPRQQEGWGYPQQYRMADREEALARARALALAEQRARRAQWLPDEVDDDDDDWEYNRLGPRERILVDAAKRRQLLEQQQREQEYARRKALEEEQWQRQLEQRQTEEDERRRRIVEEQRRIQQQKREREEARLRAEAEARARSRSRTPQSPPPNRPQSFQVHIDDPLDTTSQTPSSPKRNYQQQQRPPTPKYDERHEEAASKIQNQYRIHKSFKTIGDLEQQFKDAKSRFSFPSSVDFQNPTGEEGCISVPLSGSPDDEQSVPMDVDGQSEGKLAFTSNNYSIHAFVESMLKLLTKLDEVESWGEKKVREKRRHVVKEIEEETSRVERFWKGAWRKYLASHRSESSVPGSRPTDAQPSSDEPSTEERKPDPESSSSLEDTDQQSDSADSDAMDSTMP